MKMIHITPHNLEQYRRAILTFVKRYDKDSNSYKRFFHLKRQHLQKGQTKIILALWDGKIIALLAFCNNGYEPSFFLFSPQHKYRPIFTKFLQLAKVEIQSCHNA